jgi:TonB family protein
MSVVSPAPLSEFPRDHGSLRADFSTRVSGALLTVALYAFFALLALWSLKNVPVPYATAEVTVNLLPEIPKKRVIELPRPFLARLILPHAELPALPVFTVASTAPLQTPSPIPASAAPSSPMRGGTADAGPLGQAASGDGTNGNGFSLTGCIDPIWLRALGERLRRHFYYPQTELSSHITGWVMVHLVVRRDGSLSSLEITKSSGVEALDKAAYDIVHSAAPFPPISDRMHIEQVDGKAVINFGVKGSGAIRQPATCQ